MTREEFDEMLLAPNCTDCTGLTEDDDGVWQCVFQGKRTTEDCYGSDYCCMLYLIQKNEDEDDDEEKDQDDYCEEADGDCDCCEISDTCGDASPPDDDCDDEDDDLCECDCEECNPPPVQEVKEEIKPVEEMGGTI